MKFIKKPKLSSFLAIKTHQHIAIKCSLSIVKTPYLQSQNTKELLVPTTPWQNIDFWNAKKFKVKIIGLDQFNNQIFKKTIYSYYSSIDIKIPIEAAGKEILHIQLYETALYPGVEVLLGSFIPTSLQNHNKIVVCDFDKTLVETKYSSVKEVYKSLSNPIHIFPKVDKSIDMLKGFIQKGFTPFILSASPHFYEKPFRDWLYQNQIYTHNIFLKNYKKIFSFFDNDLTTKDISNQGYYKLSQLVDIILMTSLPREIKLVGDAFESDTLVYLLLRAIITDRVDPNTLWRHVRDLKEFQISSKQVSHFLVRLNQVSNLASKQRTEIDIHIRCAHESDIEKVKIPKSLDFILQEKKSVNFYITSSTSTH